MPAAPALILSGGNALGAYHAGTWTAAIIAGNAPDPRDMRARLAVFRTLASDGVELTVHPPPLRTP